MVDTADGYTLARLPSPLIRGVENLGAGRIEHSRAAGGASTATRDKEREQDLVQTRARERERSRDARTHASTHATAVHTHQGIPRKDRRRKKTRIEREYETHGEMKSIETAENCTNLAGRD